MEKEDGGNGGGRGGEEIGRVVITTTGTHRGVYELSLKERLIETALWSYSSQNCEMMIKPFAIRMI